MSKTEKKTKLNWDIHIKLEVSTFNFQMRDKKGESTHCKKKSRI
jgi:hypothetical protein